MPTVSVVIPTFNRARLLREAVDSVLRQTYTDHEIVVVDDGSTDDTAEEMAGYGDRVRYFRQENQGVNAARNRAVARASGRYIALLDSDDVWLPFLLELLVGLLERFPRAGFAYADFHIFRDGEPLRPRGLLSWHGPAHRWESVFGQGMAARQTGLVLPAKLPRGEFGIYLGDLYEASLDGPQVPTSSSLIRRSSMGDLRFPESDSFCGDWEFFARLSKSHGAVYADIEAMLNRSHEDDVRLTRSDGVAQLECRVALIDRVWRADAEFMSSHAARVDATQYAVLMRLARLYLLKGKNRECRACLERASALGGGADRPARMALRLGATLPGAGAALRGLRSLRNHLFEPRGPLRDEASGDRQTP